MIARILRTAPATGAPLDEWRTWARTLTSDMLNALSEHTARALRGCAESTRARVRAWFGALPAPMVQCLLLRAVRAAERDRRRLAKWADCGPTAEACEGERQNEPAPEQGEIE